MCKLEPALIAVPDPLVVMFVLEGLSIGVEYLEEDLAREFADWRYLIVEVILPFSKLVEDVLTHGLM